MTPVTKLNTEPSQQQLVSEQLQLKSSKLYCNERRQTEGTPLLTTNVLFINPLLPKSDKDFTLSNARQFYLSKGDPLGV